MVMTRWHGGLGWAGDPCGMKPVASAQTGELALGDGEAWMVVLGPG